MDRTTLKSLISVSLFVLRLLNVETALCQVKDIKVKKVWAKDHTFPYDGEKLVVEINFGDSTIITPDYDYYLHKLRPLSDSIKLAVIGKLLGYKNDTSVCGLKVYKYNYNGYERVCALTPKSIRFPIQVDALYMINVIVAQEGASFCSCFPVVINTKTGEELNKYPKLIEEFYSVYEQWYKECLSSGKLQKFAFNTPEYSWFNAAPFTFTN